MIERLLQFRLLDRASCLWTEPQTFSFLGLSVRSLGRLGLLGLRLRRRHGRAVQVDILPRGGVLQGLQVRQYGSARQRAADVRFDALQQAMAALDGPLPRNQDVERDEPARARLMRTERVELPPVVRIPGERSLQRLLILAGKRGVHQTGDGAADETDPRGDDVAGDDQGHDGIERLPTGQRHGADTHEHAGGGPDVGQEVVGIGFERDRLVPLARAQQDQTDAEVHQRGGDGDQQAEADVLEGPGADQPMHRGGADGAGGHEDQRAFDDAREVLRLVMAEGVLVVGRTGGDDQHRQRHERAGKVDERFQRIRQQTDRIREEVGPCLQGNRDERRGDGEPGEACQRSAVHGAPLKMLSRTPCPGPEALHRPSRPPAAQVLQPFSVSVVIASPENAAYTGLTDRGLLERPRPGDSMSTTTVETHPNVLSTSAVIGDSVVNRAGESLGKIEEIMLDLEKGRVAYAILSFPGMGDKLFAVPFEALKLDATREHFTLDTNKDKLKNAPSFDKNNPPKASDRTWGAEVYKFYAIKPYWQ